MFASGKPKQHCSPAIKWFRALRAIELNAVEDIRACTRGLKGWQRWNGQDMGQIEEQREEGENSARRRGKTASKR